MMVDVFIDLSWLPLITIEINYRLKLSVINHFTFIIIIGLLCIGFTLVVPLFVAAGDVCYDSFIFLVFLYTFRCGISHWHNF